MATDEHPGVYIAQPPGPQTIVAAGTSATAFVGAAEKGPCGAPTPITSWAHYVATFGGLAWGQQLPSAVYAFFAQGGTACYVVRATPNPPGALRSASLAHGALAFGAASGGAWGNSLAVSITNYPDTTPAGETPAFAVNVFYRMPLLQGPAPLSDRLAAWYIEANEVTGAPGDGFTSFQVESFPGFTAADLQKDPDDPAKPSNLEARINGASLFVRVAVSAGAVRPANLSPAAALTGGAGDALSAPLDLASALASLDELRDVSLLVTPETVMIPDVGRQREVTQQSIAYCGARPQHDLFHIADIPFGLAVDEAVAFKTGAAAGAVPQGPALNSSYAALYYPWITFLNPATNVSVPMAPSGAMAGVYAATDASVGVWMAPAGITNGVLSIATGLSRTVTDVDQDVLNPDGVNAIRNLIRYGICAYGARTLSTDPSLIYVNVRRLLTEIELSISRGLQSLVFEPDDPQLWAIVTREITVFLTGLWSQGALFGATASEAFFVTCDVSNNPPDAILDGLLNVDIGVAPIHPAEFTLIRIQLAMAAGS